MKWQMWSNEMFACANDDATMIVSPLGTTSGPSIAAAAIPATRVLFPFPRATDSAAVPTSGAKVSRKKRDCHGRTENGSSALRPCVIVRPDR